MFYCTSLAKKIARDRFKTHNDNNINKLFAIKSRFFKEMEEITQDLPEPVGNVIKSFNEEIDILSKTWEDWEAHTNELSESFETTPRRPRKEHTATYATTIEEPNNLKDPPPTRSKLRGVGTPAEPPPEPVRTPFPPMYATPNLHRTRVERSNSVEPPDDLLGKMRRALDDQERIIQKLQEENDMLREKLRTQSSRARREEAERLFTLEASRMEDDHSSYYHDYRQNFNAYQDATPNRTRRFTSQQDYYHEEPKARRPPPASKASPYRRTPASTPARGIRSPPRRIYTGPMRSEEIFLGTEAFTPGTRLVAKLATLMKMEYGHHAPLSVILDRHWDQLKPYFDDDNGLF